QQLSLQERLRLREEKKKQAALLKALETPEEKRARRLAKKEAKERKKREKMGWGEEYMDYTNTDNPFGDNNLLGTFNWSKALEKKGISHLDEKDLKERNKQIQVENRLELQKVKQLRLEREREKAMREQEREMLQREKEAEHFKTWEEQEENFHLQQAKLRSKIRIRDGRAKPIDLLAKYISAENDDLAVEMHEPYTFLSGLTVSDMEDLVEDIQVYMELEQGKNMDFWRDMTIITEDEIAKLRKLEASRKGGPGEMPLTGKAYLWADKYRPRKPRFFNRVHTGFEWNKYNQTHYDFDNPPPKTVQGYKFNIFYPDLIDKRSTPEYFLEACQDSKDFAILHFHAGPPYEDIAFKIVHREWEYSRRHGFRCQFANGIFQLWFHFKRYRYRR
ncbi:CATIN protein, partial [Locustella ochotensis]|nr:CATIN protein [Locustella ochotensis]